MTVITSPEQFNVADLFVDLRPSLGLRLLLKSEGANLAGSIKLKAAVAMVDAAERAGLLLPGGALVESSSGNLGVALAMIAASRGYDFVCVTDSRCTPTARRMMEAFGATIECVTEPHPETGLLGARLATVRRLVQSNPRWFWPNQYVNEANWQAHYATTGREILTAIGRPDVVFIGAGTCGTLMGVTRYLRVHSPDTRVVAVDSVGSVTFGDPAGTRHIPGLGAAVLPPLFDSSEIDDVVMVDEADTVRACRALARVGFLFGGSTGTVVAGAARWLAQPGREETVAVALAPDIGERYLSSIHDDDWVTARFGPCALSPSLPSPASPSASSAGPRSSFSAMQATR